MTATLLLIRHAAHDDYGKRLTGRADGVHLSATGKGQARRLGERLADEPIEAVYSSPRERTRETADAVAAPHGLEPVEAEALDEIELGDWTGAEIVSLTGMPSFTVWNERRATARPPGGESMGEVVARSRGFADKAAARHSGKTVALVSHSDVIRGVVASYLGLSLDNILRFEIGPASVSRLEVGEWGGRVLSLNEGAPA